MDKTRCIYAKRLPVCESNEPLKLGNSPPAKNKRKRKKKEENMQKKFKSYKNIQVKHC